MQEDSASRLSKNAVYDRTKGPVYFISDAHLGSRAIAHGRTLERKLVSFLDQVKHKASAVYMLGDMFDFWYEYKNVVPKGYTRLLGKISELTDLGVEVHYFIGNHDIWQHDYFERECGMIVHHGNAVLEIFDRTFYLAHGDGLGSVDRGFKCIRAVFHNKLCRTLYSALHPRWGIAFGLEWAKRSRLKRADGSEPPYQGEQNEELIVFAKDYLKTHPDINFFVFGHRHIELDLMLSRTTRLLILGDWISQFTYAVFDGEHLFLENYIEGESRP